MKNQIVFYVLVLFVNYAYSSPTTAEFEKNILRQYNLFKTAEEIIEAYENGAALLSGIDSKLKTLPLEKATLTENGILFTKSKTLVHMTSFSPLTFSVDHHSIIVNKVSPIWPQLEFLEPKNSVLWNVILPASFAQSSGSSSKTSIAGIVAIAVEYIKSGFSGRITYPPSACMATWNAFKSKIFTSDVSLVGPPNCDKTKPTLNLKFQGIVAQLSEFENGPKIYSMKIPTANHPVSVVLDPNNVNLGSWRIMKSEDGKPDVEMRSQGYNSRGAKSVVFSELIRKRNSFSETETERLKKGAALINAMDENEYDTDFGLIDWCLSCREVPEVKTQVFGETAPGSQGNAQPAQ